MGRFYCAENSFAKSLASPPSVAYYSSPRNTNRAANAAATRVAGLMGGRAEEFSSADRSEKNFADLLTKRRLFFIISFLCCDANDAAQTSSTAPGKAGVASSLTTKQPISVGA